MEFGTHFFLLILFLPKILNIFVYVVFSVPLPLFLYIFKWSQLLTFISTASVGSRVFRTNTNSGYFHKSQIITTDILMYIVFRQRHRHDLRYLDQNIQFKQLFFNENNTANLTSFSLNPPGYPQISSTESN